MTNKTQLTTAQFDKQILLIARVLKPKKLSYERFLYCALIYCKNNNIDLSETATYQCQSCGRVNTFPICNNYKKCSDRYKMIELSHKK